MPTPSALSFPPGTRSLSTGLPALDEALPGGGLPLGSLIEISGSPSSGRTSLAFSALAAATRRGEEAAYVDGARSFFAPSARRCGVDLERLLVVRPEAPPRRKAAATMEALEAADALLASRGFVLTVIDLTEAPVSPPAQIAFRLARRAQRAEAVLLALTRPPNGHATLLGSAVSLALRVRRVGFRYLPSPHPPCVLGGVKVRVEIRKSKFAPEGPYVDLALSAAPPLA